MDSFARKSALRFCSWFLALSLLATAGLGSLYFTILQPGTTKNIVAESGAYESMSNAAVNAVIAQKNEVILIPLGDTAIENILRQVFTPADLQKTTEVFIDKTYSWLDSEATTLPLALDIASNKQVFITKTGDYLENRLSALPACTTRAQMIANTDPFISVCLPPGVDIAAQRATLERQLIANTNIPSELGISEVASGKIDSAKTTLDAASKLPERYQAIKKLFFIMLGVSLALAIGVVAASQNLVAGIGTLGKLLLKGGVTIIVIGAVLMIALPHLATGVNLGTSQAADTVILPLLKAIVQAIGKAYLLFGVAVAIVGGAGFGFMKYSKR